MDYNKTFEKRCHAYTYAVRTYPRSLEHEFRTAVNQLNIQTTDQILNIPASCIELKQYFTVDPAGLYEFETNEAFASLTNMPVCSFFDIPLKDKSLTKIISLASLHHMTYDERPRFYEECKRLLQKDGSLIIGDVLKGSQQDIWLNGYVAKNNSMGHNGFFWNEDDCKLLEKHGFKTTYNIQEYTWDFLNGRDMVDFVKNLFGLDLATDEDISKNVETYLTLKHTDKGISIDWKLCYICATLDP